MNISLIACATISSSPFMSECTPFLYLKLTAHVPMLQKVTRPQLNALNACWACANSSLQQMFSQQAMQNFFLGDQILLSLYHQSLQIAKLFIDIPFLCLFDVVYSLSLWHGPLVDRSITMTVLRVIYLKFNILLKLLLQHVIFQLLIFAILPVVDRVCPCVMHSQDAQTVAC